MSAPIRDPAGDRFQHLSELFLAAVREALPQEEVASVRLAFRYPRDTRSLQDLPPGCVQVEIVRSAAGQSAACGYSSPEIEITPEMIKAGANVIFENQEDLMAWDLAQSVYRAMERARKDVRKTART